MARCGGAAADATRSEPVAVAKAMERRPERAVYVGWPMLAWGEPPGEARRGRWAVEAAEAGDRQRREDVVR